ncbi:hypothetical protein [Rhizobium sp. LjRoot258]|uniref:hypothetical protein n=1 Tax=Rhizobium sp. LjRoot258 TaxID=3342299 RepID=UPI003ED0FCE0
MAKQVLFVQGAGEGVHDRWDTELVASLARELGESYAVRYPRMPGEDDPRPYVRGVKVARPRGKLNSGVAPDWPEPSPKLSEGEP